MGILQNLPGHVRRMWRRLLPVVREEAPPTQTRQLEAIRDISLEMTRELHLSRLLGLIAQRLLEFVPAESTAVMLWDEASRILRVGAWGGTRDWLGNLEMGLGEGVLGRVAERREGRVVNDYQTCPEALPHLRQAGLTAVAAEPLVYQDRLLGVIAIGLRDERRFSRQDSRALALFASAAAIAIQNAQLHAAALRLGQELAAVLRSTTSVMADPNQASVLGRIVTEAAAITGSTHVKLLLLDPETQILRVAAAQGTAMAAGEERRLGVGLSGIAAATGRVVYSADCRVDPRNVTQERDRALGLVSFLGLPVKIHNRVLGVLSFNTTALKDFSADEITYLAAFADQAAAAVHIATLFHEEQRRRQQVEAVRQVAEEIVRELDLTRLLNLLTRRAGKLVGATAGTVYLWDEGEQALVSKTSYGLSGWFVDVRSRLGEGVAGKVAERRRGMIVRDYPSSPLAHPRVAAETGVREAIGEPLLCRNRLVGVLAFGVKADEHAFTPQDQATLRLFAVHAAIAIENARLYAAAQREVAERIRIEAGLVARTRQLEAVRAVSAEIAQELDKDVVLNLILRRASELVGVQAAAVFLWDESARVLVPVVSQGYESSIVEARLRLGEGVVGAAAQKRRGLVVNDFRTSPYATPWLLERTSHTAVLAEPLIYQERLLGVISLSNRRTDRVFGSEDLELLRLFAGQAAIAIENARLFEQVRESRRRAERMSGHLLEVREDESRHIARELHDEIGQLLTGLRFTLEAATPRGGQPLPAGLAKALLLTEELTGRVRQMSLNLRPATLDDQGLVPALAWLFGRQRAQTGLRVRFEHQRVDAVRFPSEVETAAYRIVQEGLTNVARHAEVQEATVRLWADDDMLGLQVEDHGVGFGPRASMAAHVSSGLIGMTERADLLGGRVTIESGPGAGTRVMAELPLRGRLERRGGPR